MSTFPTLHSCFPQKKSLFLGIAIVSSLTLIVVGILRSSSSSFFRGLSINVAITMSSSGCFLIIAIIIYLVKNSRNKTIEPNITNIEGFQSSNHNRMSFDLSSPLPSPSPPSPSPSPPLPSPSPSPPPPSPSPSPPLPSPSPSPPPPSPPPSPSPSPPPPSPSPSPPPPSPSPSPPPPSPSPYPTLVTENNFEQTKVIILKKNYFRFLTAKENHFFNLLDYLDVCSIGRFTHVSRDTLTMRSFHDRKYISKLMSRYPSPRNFIHFFKPSIQIKCAQGQDRESVLKNSTCIINRIASLHFSLDKNCFRISTTFNSMSIPYRGLRSLNQNFDQFLNFSMQLSLKENYGQSLFDIVSRRSPDLLQLYLAMNTDILEKRGFEALEFMISDLNWDSNKNINDPDSIFNILLDSTPLSIIERFIATILERETIRITPNIMYKLLSIHRSPQISEMAQIKFLTNVASNLFSSFLHLKLVFNSKTSENVRVEAAIKSIRSLHSSHLPKNLVVLIVSPPDLSYTSKQRIKKEIHSAKITSDSKVLPEELDILSNFLTDGDLTSAHKLLYN